MDSAGQRRLQVYRSHLTPSRMPSKEGLVQQKTSNPKKALLENQEAIYNQNLLRELDWESRKAKFKNGISPLNPGQNLIMRPLNIGDYDLGFLQILGQLTSVGDVSRQTFEERFHAMKRCPGTYYITVIEDVGSSQIIGTATLVVEQKFIHSASSRGRIEDVVVSDLYRGKQLGKLLVETLNLLGKHVGCYKMSLECKDDNIPFYEGLGYKNEDQNFMVIRYKD